MLSDNFVCVFFFSKVLKFLHPDSAFQFKLEKHLPVLFRWVCPSFLRNNVCKKSCLPATPFGDLLILLQENQKKSFVLQNNEISDFIDLEPVNYVQLFNMKLLLFNQLAQLISNAGGVGAVVDFIKESKGNVRLPGIMMLGYVAAHSETLAMSVILSKV